MEGKCAFKGRNFPPSLNYRSRNRFLFMHRTFHNKTKTICSIFTGTGTVSAVHQYRVLQFFVTREVFTSKPTVKVFIDYEAIQFLCCSDLGRDCCFSHSKEQTKKVFSHNKSSHGQLHKFPSNLMRRFGFKLDLKCLFT